MKNLLLILLPFALLGQEIKFDKTQVLPTGYFWGDPMLIVGKDSTKRAHPGYGELSNPSTIILDCRGTVDMSKITFWDMEGEQVVKVEVSKTLARSEKKIVLYNQATNKYKELITLTVNQQVRFIHISVLTKDSDFPGAFKVYGKYVTDKLSLNPIYRSYTVSRATTGICSWPWFKPNTATFFGYQRLSCEAYWPIPTSNGKPDGKQIKGALNLDNAGGDFRASEMIANYKAQNTVPIITVQGMPEYILSGPGGTNREKGIPVVYGTDTEDPESYKDYSDFIVQYTNKFGADGIIEPGNEPNKTWKVKGYRETQDYYAYHRPFELAALMYKVYTVCKKANPNCIISMPGLANLDWKYVLLMSLWFEANTPEKTFAADIIQYHHYCTDGKQGISPEADSLYGKLAETVAYTSVIAPSKKIFLGEFAGWDKKPSPQSINSGDIEGLQAQYIVSAVNISHRAGFDASIVYNIADDGDGLYRTCGLMSPYPNSKPYKSYYALQNLLSTVVAPKPQLSRRDSILLDMNVLLDKYKIK